MCRDVKVCVNTVGIVLDCLTRFRRWTTGFVMWVNGLTPVGKSSPFPWIPLPWICCLAPPNVRMYLRMSVCSQDTTNISRGDIDFVGTCLNSITKANANALYWMHSACSYWFSCYTTRMHSRYYKEQ